MSSADYAFETRNCIQYSVEEASRVYRRRGCLATASLAKQYIYTNIHTASIPYTCMDISRFSSHFLVLGTSPLSQGMTLPPPHTHTVQALYCGLTTWISALAPRQPSSIKLGQFVFFPPHILTPLGATNQILRKGRPGRIWRQSNTSSPHPHDVIGPLDRAPGAAA